MRRTIILLLVSLLAGCTYYTPQRSPHGARVVTAIEVSTTANGHRETFRYTESDKVEKLLNYLRYLETGSVAPISPETFRTSSWELRLQLSDGSESVYCQLSNLYLQKNGGPWRRIDETQGSRLALLVASLPPDPL